MTSPVEQWSRALSAWQLPPELLDGLQDSPWVLPREVFRRRADQRISAAQGETLAEIGGVLPENGSLLDVGCAAGASSLPVAARLPVSNVIGVDLDDELLGDFAVRAKRIGVRHEVVLSAWPLSEPRTADVVVCGNVVYNVADIAPFVRALTESAHERVVVELAQAHPLTELAPLWQQFHVVERPVGPIADDFVAILDQLGIAPKLRSWTLPSEAEHAQFSDMVEVSRRRLCLPPEQAPQVRNALLEFGVDPQSPPDLGSSGRNLVTVSWPGAARR